MFDKKSWKKAKFSSKSKFTILTNSSQHARILAENNLPIWVNA